MMDRREFAVGLPALLAMAGAGEAQSTRELKVLSSGTFTPGPLRSVQTKRASRAYAAGLLKAGNIRVEMHESFQEAGAEHEQVGTHKHNEIWFVQKGVASLFINGTEQRMEAGEVGLVCAGDEHWIKNIGDGELSYFVIAVGPPE